MQGQSEVLSECEIVENALEYRLLTDTLVPLSNPVGEDIRTDGTAGVSYVQGQIHLKDWLNYSAKGLELLGAAAGEALGKHRISAK